MSDRPILFSAPMIRALLDGRKTQTRRALKAPYGTMEFVAGEWVPIVTKFRAGDRLWVREAWKAHSTFEGVAPRDIPQSRIVYMADDAYAPSGSRGRPGMFMPRWASRVTLAVTDVRVERLQGISEEGAKAEGVVCKGRMDGEPWDHCYVPGVTRGYEADAATCFSMLWETINGDGSWAANPWVAAITFTVHRQNIDAPSPSSDSAEG